MSKRKKITVIGAGNVGATIAHILTCKELGDIVLLDVVEGLPQGKALDLMESRPIDGLDVEIMGTNAYEDISGSDMVIITAGLARKPGMSREDLIDANIKIVGSCAKKIKEFCPDSVVIVVTNPLDSMVYLCSRVTGFPKNRIMGQAGVLDTARLKCFISMELGVSVKQVSALVLGGHGDSMVPLTRYTSVGGVPVERLIPQERLDEIIQRTRKAGGEIVSLLKTGSAFYSPASATARMAESILKDQGQVLPCSVYCGDEYNVGGYFMGVLAKLGGNGVEEIIEVELDPNEREMFEKSLDEVKKSVQFVDEKMG